MKLKFLLIIPALMWSGLESYGQGCVAIRQFSGVGNAIGQGNLLEKGEWNFNTNYRYFKSFRHFRGTHQERERVANNTEVINWSHALDFNISYAFSQRVYGVVTIPIAYNERSSLYEHGRTERHMTYSGGLADMRIGAGYWLLGEEKSKSGNVAVGAGIKLPTGDYNAQGTFYNVGPYGSPETRPVDQSIQLGDGGVGLILDSQGYRFLQGNFIWYYDGFYMLNPRNTNGTQTFRARQSEAIMSVPDQYAFRTGFLKTIPKIHGLGFSLGGRIEGIPVRDLIGGSDGFRRPGYILSVEPGASYMRGNFTTTLNMPIAILRNRTRSLTDIADSTPDNPRHGDAAFADYLVNIGLAYRLTKKQPTPFHIN